MDTRLIELLVCPVCKGPLLRSEDGHALVCNADRLAFPIRDGIPVMLENEAVSLDAPGPVTAPAPDTSAD
ncbi:MAG TPA: Trm112 family protein [Aquabacterium sp.]|nr:Trm112 family protein [Aquabacterium sp.]HRH28663.1 Trm112 family protein [Aquabacterium sp.]